MDTKKRMNIGMASFTGNMSLIASLVLVFLFISPSISKLDVKVTIDDLNQICSHTDDPSYCVQTLQFDPRTAKADFHGLAEISIDVAEKNAKGTFTLIMSLLANATDPQLKERYTKCSINYSTTISFIEEAKKKLSSGDLDGVANFGARGGVEADSCEARFEVPPYDSSLQQESHNLGTLTKLISEIAIYLQSGGH